MHKRSLSASFCALSLVGAVAVGCGDDTEDDGSTSSTSTTGTPAGSGGSGATGGTGTAGGGGMGTGGEGGMATGGMGGMATGGAGGMGVGGMGVGGGGNKMVNGCDEATAMDMTGAASVQIDFPGLAFSYTPKCVKVSKDTNVNFVAGSISTFTAHPLVGGEVIGVNKTPDPNSPITKTDTGTTAQFTMKNPGTFGYYCDIHALAGMAGAIFVVP